MARELDDGSSQYERLYDDLPRLDQRARVCKWLAACAEHPARSMVIDELSASYETARSPAAALYHRLAKTIAHFEAQGWAPVS